MKVIATPSGEILRYTKAGSEERAWRRFAPGQDAPLFRSIAEAWGYRAVEYRPLLGEKAR